MSFASDPGRDDDSPPPAHIVIPDDARELDRDVLAYRREMRARRRRERLTHVLRPLFGPRRGPQGGPQDRRSHSSVLPLIVTCVALSMLAGAMLSVVTISPAAAPTVPKPRPASASPATPAGVSRLPAGTVQVESGTQPLSSLVSAALALVPAGCRCGTALRRLAGQALAAHVGLYFVGEGPGMRQVAGLTNLYGDGWAVAAADTRGVLDAAYHPAGLTVLLVRSDATTMVRRDLPPDFQLGSVLPTLLAPGTRPAS